MTSDQPGDRVAVHLGQPERQRAAHRQPHHEDLVAAARAARRRRARPRRTSRPSGSGSSPASVVPWPGSRGSATVSPAAARCSAHGRSDCGVPVKPWQSRTPTGPPSWSNGSAPGSTRHGRASSHEHGGGSPRSRRGHPLVFARRRTPAGRAPRRPEGGAPGVLLVAQADRPRARSCGCSSGRRSGPRERPGARARRSSPATTCRSPTRSSCRWWCPGGSPSWPSSDYFTGTRRQGPADRGVLPRRRAGARSTAPAARRARRRCAPGCKVLGRGDLLGIYPEGTRSPDGRLYRGKTGVARMALEADVPVIPVAMIDTDEIQPPGRKMPEARHGSASGSASRWTSRRYEGMEGDRFVLRSITDEIMYELMELSGQEYVDVYAQVGQGPAQGREAAAEAAGAPGRRPTPTTAPPAERRRAARPDGRWGIETAVWRALAVFRALGAGLRRAVLRPALRRVRPPARPAGWSSPAMAAWTVVTACVYRAAGRPPLAGARRSTWPSPWPPSSAPAGSTTPTRIDAGAPTLPVVLGGRAGAGLGGPGRLAGAAVGRGGRRRRGRPGRARRRSPRRPPTTSCCCCSPARSSATSCRWPAAASRRCARGAGLQAATRGARAAVPRRSTTACCRCSRWSAGAAEAGGEAAELGRLAAEQEEALRALVTRRARARRRRGRPARAAVVVRLALVTVSTPATPVLLPAAARRELAAAVGAALANVAAHGGTRRGPGCWSRTTATRSW